MTGIPARTAAGLTGYCCNCGSRVECLLGIVLTCATQCDTITGVIMLNTPDIRMNPNGHDCGWVAVRVACAVLGREAADWLAKLPNPIQGTAPELVSAM